MGKKVNFVEICKNRIVISTGFLYSAINRLYLFNLIGKRAHDWKENGR
jgi:hypothetical protein